MEKGRGKGTDTLQNDNVFTRKEYIEREAAIDALQNHYEVRNAVQNGIMDECVMLMMRVPAADIAPVRHGRWRRVDYKPLGHDYICSVCGGKNDRVSQYCPDCGARMKG